MSSCGGNCSCGSNCQCGNDCNCKYPELNLSMSAIRMGYVDEPCTSSAFAENGGCNCGSNCTCDPCKCK